MKLADAKKASSFKLLQVGEPGSGKTTRALSSTRFGAVKVFDIDAKLVGLRPRLSAEAIALIDFEVPATFEEFMQGVTALSKAPGAFSTVVVDTWSRAHDLSIESVRQLNPKMDGRQLFGVVMEKNRALFNTLLALPMNVIINAHTGKEEDAEGRAKVTSSTAGKFGTEMPQRFNEVHYCFLNEMNKHRFRGMPTNAIVARTVMPAAMLDANGVFRSETLDIFEEVAFRGAK